jgi:hypothetical protein
VSRVANWGRYLLATELAVDAAINVGRDVLHAGQGDTTLLDTLVMTVFWILLVYGVLNWSKLAHGFLVVSTAVGMPLLILLAVHYGYGSELRGPLVVFRFVFSGATLIWLLLPSVRRQYWRSA